MILASVLREVSPQMNIELLTEILGLPDDRADMIVGQLHEFYSGRAEIFMQPVFAYQGGTAQGEAPTSPAGMRALHGVIALFLLAGMIWSLPGSIREMSGMLRRLPPGAATAFVFGNVAATMLAGLTAAALGLLALALTHPAALGPPGRLAVMLVLYLLCLGLAGAALSLLLKTPDVVYAGGSFLLILTAVLGGVFFDLAEISPSLGWGSAVSASGRYVTGVMSGSGSAAIALIVMSAICAAAVLLLCTRHGR